MRLRKKRKTPKRYDDYRWEAEDRVEAHSTTPSPISRTRSPIGTRPSNLPFNPNLPPAAFPTLEYGVPRRADPIEIQPPCPADTTSLVINKKWRSQMNWLGYRRSQALKEGEARIPTSPHDETFPNVNLESMFDDSLGSTSPTKLTDSTWHSMVPDSEVYDRNMRILEKMAKRTDDDWNIVEMITSDDESLSPVKVRYASVARVSFVDVLVCKDTRTSTQNTSYTDDLHSLGRTVNRPSTGLDLHIFGDQPKY